MSNQRNTSGGSSAAVFQITFNVSTVIKKNVVNIRNCDHGTIDRKFASDKLCYILQSIERKKVSEKFKGMLHLHY
jgi:hypothetical protein